MIALGIDPGSWRTGWGVVAADGPRLRCLDAGVIRFRDGEPLVRRLARLHAEVLGLLDAHRPERVGMETVFHGANTRSLVVLGQARGALAAAVGARDLSLDELSPAEVKKAVTGKGGASKPQVAQMVAALLGLGPARNSSALDDRDALAVAIATVHRTRQALGARG